MRYVSCHRGHAVETMEGCSLVTLLWIVAVILVISGIVAILRKQLLWGAVLIVVGLLVGPGGVSIFT
ncbi:GPGG-motif small membrane protein [Pengzhenrongella sp.]|uniref:GPGG-motif small membrane protein n=1 Tax=Pengzhenrongella sp. TaxID=2888820 RepID=UPI002F948F2B